MSKSKSGASGISDRKGDGLAVEGDARMLSGQPSSGMAPTRAALSGATQGHTFVVQPQHGQHLDIKNFNKLARPIAPAPNQAAQVIAARNVQSSQANIPSIISSSANSGSSENVNLNLVSSSSTGVTSVAGPVSLSQPNILQIGSTASTTNNSTTHTSSLPATAIPLNVIRNAAVGQAGTGQIQSFPPNFAAQIQRGTTTLQNTKSGAILRPGPSPVQIPGGAFNPGVASIPLTIPRQPLLQTIKTTIAQGSRSQSPAVGGQPIVQAQPQDLSRTSLALHGSITTGGSHPLHNLTRLGPPMTDLNRVVNPLSQDLTRLSGHLGQDLTKMTMPINQEGRILNRTVQGGDHRINVSLSEGQRELLGQTMVLNTHGKIGPSSVGSDGKVLISQHGSTIKTVNLAAPAPVIINSASPSVTTITTVANTLPIPIAKVTPQRQMLGSIQLHPSSQAPVVGGTIPASITQASASSSLRASASSTTAVADASQSSSQAPANMLLTSELATRPQGAISMNSTVSMASCLRPENRAAQSINPGPESSMWYQHYVYQQSSQSTIVRPTASGTYATFLPQPGKIPNSSSSLPAASHLAHAISVASSNVRFNPSMMMVDHARQQQTLHSAFNVGGAANNTGDKGSGVKVVAPELILNSGRAANLITASVGVQSQANTGPLAIPVSNPSSSPRPSILRKRNVEGNVVVRKPNFNLSQEPRCHSPPRVDTARSASPKTSGKLNRNFSPMSENSQSSTDTALSSNDAHTPTQNHAEKGVKSETDACVENGVSSVIAVNNVPASPVVSQSSSIVEASPRKRARKQLLHANEELKDNLSSSEDEHEVDSSRLKEEECTKDDKKGEYTDEDGVRWVYDKPRPGYVLIQPEMVNNKTKHNHFIRYSEVKPKEERRPTVNELSNQRGIFQKMNGWKLYFAASQLEDLMDVEKCLQAQFAGIQSALVTKKLSSEDNIKLHELAQANIQRCELLQSQLSEARSSMIKTLEHKPRIQEIVNKHISKRPIKKKERT